MLTGKNMTVKEMARLGGLARAKKLSDKRRREIASNAARVRWDKRAKKEV